MKKFFLVLAVMFGCSVLTDFQPLGVETQAQCFDGTDNDSDGATDCADPDCAPEAGCQAPPVCGDGLLGLGEGCDDGNTSAGDGCDANCQLEVCGDGLLNNQEDCEGKDLNGQDCAALGFAGGVLACAKDCSFDTGACTNNESCNDNLDNDADGQIDCQDGDCAQDPLCAPTCGNGSLDPGEDCDGTNLNGQNCGALGFAGGVLACANDCAFDTGACIAVGCGNGIVDAGESCDDSNITAGDGCNANCQFEVCGDGVSNNNGQEQCDDGNNANGDGCDAACVLEFCGDGIVNNGTEECDDNNNIDGDGCDATCTVEVCGDGILNNAGLETCDDANATAGDGCDTVCEVEPGFVCAGSPSVCATLCGDGIIAGAEQCDDANSTDGDGCNAICEVETGFVCAGVPSICITDCGDGSIAGAEQCDDANTFDGDGCDTVCEVEPGFDCLGSPSVCATLCGDGIIAGAEQCDDANSTDGDGCNAACVVDVLSVVQVAAGSFHTCALLNNGAVRCWGRGEFGRLGYGNQNNIGDNETPASAGDVNVGGTVVQVSAGQVHTCALLSNGNVRCWGLGDSGRLGYGNANDIGNNESPASAGDVNVGGSVVQVAAGLAHTCALLDTGAVHCWGASASGQLGYGNTNNIGDNESPADAGDVNVGGFVVQIAAGDSHTCALLNTGAVRCWGFGNEGQLGYGNTNNIGDNESPASAGDVNVGGTVVQLSAGRFHTCALLTTGKVRCWGEGANGQLGYGNTISIGDNESPAAAGDVNIGGTAAIQVAAGGSHTCALLNNGAVRCWGLGSQGQLGYGNTISIGDNESPAAAGDVNIGGTAIQVVAGSFHTYVLLENGNIRGWGNSAFGQLGYGNTDTIGDDESPASAGDVFVF